MDNIYFMILGVFAGMLSSLFGVGGGMIIVPTLSFMFLPKESIAISVFQMVFSSSFGTLLNIRKKLLDFKYCIPLALGGLIGGFISGFILSVIDGIYFLIIFFMISLISLYKFTSQGSKKINNDHLFLSDTNKFLGLFAGGVITGLFAISLGIGGGLLLAPIIAYLLGYNSKQIVPVSLFFIVFSSVSGIVSLIQVNAIDDSVIKFGLIIGLSSLVGVILGIQILKVIKITWHRAVLIAIYIFATVATLSKILSHYYVWWF